MKRVILDHDGGVDDFIALALLCSQPNIELIGVSILEADCFMEPAISVTRKVLALMGKSPELIPLLRSNLSSIHPFPDMWRTLTINLDDLPCINTREILDKTANLKIPDANEPVELANWVMNSPTKVTIVATGPLSNIAWCVDRYGSKFCDNIEEIVVMGGAVDANGNVKDRSEKGAEWNIYWDIPAAKIVLNATLPTSNNFIQRVVLFSLDATNLVPLNSKFVKRFGLQNEFPASQFVGSAWALTTHHGYLDILKQFYVWDGLTAAFLIDQSIVELKTININLITDGIQEGQMTRADSTNTTGIVELAVNTDADKFYELCLNQFNKKF